MRTLLLVSLLAACLACLAAGQPVTPADWSTNGKPECMLKSLAFTGGLKLVGPFLSNKFNYMCSCAGITGDLTVVVQPKSIEDTSSMEITFNGVKINTKAMKNAISNTGPNNIAPNSPLFESSPLKFKTGLNEIIVGVSCNKRANPPCYYKYKITCEKNDGYIVGDPAFVGLRGQKYQVHGVSGEIYNIVSDPDLQYNSRFVFLDSGSCPIVNGVKQRGCWHEPGSYLGEVGIQTRAGDQIHLVTGPAEEGFVAVKVNGEEVPMGDTILLADDMGSVSRNDTHVATVQVGVWEFAFENSDMFLNQRVRVMDSRNLRSHGLLGQTWRTTTYPNPIKYVEGAVDDYVIRDKNIFGNNFLYNQFN